MPDRHTPQVAGATQVNCIVNGWDIRPLEGGGFGVVDSHSILAGPFVTVEQAMKAALVLPKYMPRAASGRGRVFPAAE